MSVFQDLNFKANPFEHYAAETEPNIAEYAIRPPYLQSIYGRANALSSFLLFGERGAGKSATRLTVYSEIWKNSGAEKSPRGPLPVNLVDFSRILPQFAKGNLTDLDLVKAAAFHVIEQMLGWLASLENSDREIYVNGLDNEEKALAVALIEAFYIAVPEMDRDRSNSEALRLLNSAWSTKSVLWIGRRWDSISKITSAILAAWSRRKLEVEGDISADVEKLLKSFKTEGALAPAMITEKLVSFSRSLGFSGICILVDKVDETNATSNSAEATARLVHPILNHQQLLEIDGCSWIFFLWSNVQSHFNGKWKIRLDKIAHSSITWEKTALRKMIEQRVGYFSANNVVFADLFEDAHRADVIFADLCALASESPRELIKLLDTIGREHDASGELGKISNASIDAGSDKYAKETAAIWYADRIIQQVIRLGRVEFVNKDVQLKFKIGDQGARTKINNWQEAGLVKQDGTLPSELGSKPVYRFVVADARTARIISRRLDPNVDAETPEGEGN